MVLTHATEHATELATEQAGERASDTLELLAPGEEAIAELIVARALTPSTTRTVGLELERHVIDVADPARRVGWDRLTDVVAGFVPPAGSRITLEPGGQLELSGPPGDLSTAVRALEQDAAAVDGLLATQGLVLVSTGLDPVRAPQRVNPASRYRAMAAHFDAVGHHDDGAAMMCSTASLQLNLDAGPAAGWSQRLAHVRRLQPLLVALSASSPLAQGGRTGSACGRQGVWGRLEPGRCRPSSDTVDTVDPAHGWSEFALQAPVMFVRARGSGEFEPVRGVVRLRDWAAGRVLLDGRRPTADDVEAHLSTLWPPVRLRGFLELRFLDAVPRKFRAGLVALAVTALDDPVAADRAAAVAEPVADRHAQSVRDGLRDPRLRRAAREFFDVVAAHVPPDLAHHLEPWDELLDSGGSLDDLVLTAHRTSGPVDCLLAEELR